MTEAKQTDAMELAREMMTIPMKDLPPLAREFAEDLCRKVGGCGEVLLTALAAYAQCVEGLPCENDLYAVSPEHRQWFADRLLIEASRWRYVRDHLALRSRMREKHWHFLSLRSPGDTVDEAVDKAIDNLQDQF